MDGWAAQLNTPENRRTRFVRQGGGCCAKGGIGKRGPMKAKPAAACAIMGPHE